MGSPRIQHYNPMPTGTRCAICNKPARRSQRFVNVVLKIDVFFCGPDHKREYLEKLQAKEYDKLKIQLENVK